MLGLNKFEPGIIKMMLGSNKFDPMIPTDFFVFHTLEILKTFEIRSFFKEKRLLSHVLAGPIVIKMYASIHFMTI